MKLLLIHQNFPGQFRQLAPYLISKGYELIAICSHNRPVDFQGQILRYKEPVKNTSLPLGSSLWDEGLQRAAIIARYCQQLNDQGWIPDRILGHTGWGETIAINEVWPDIPQILWPELWILPEHGGHGVDPLMAPPSLEIRLQQLGRNSLTRVALSHASTLIVPTKHQANSFPIEYRDSKMQLIHEGIDTNIACPNLDVSYTVRGITISRSIPTITFVNRNLERLRGFDTFMRSLPKIQQQHPNVRILIIGDSEKGYGTSHSSGRPLREVIIEELQGQLDFERIYFLGRIPYPQLIAILQASWVHIYLSYPFVLGWSLLEAMSCGCCIVGSKGMPVEEVIHNGIQGVLVPITDHEKLAQATLSLLNNPSLRHQLGNAAREVVKNWDKRKLLPKIENAILDSN